MNGQKVLVTSFVICCLLIVWNEIQDVKVFPRPARFTSAALVFALLGIVAMLGAPQLAAAFGIGVDVTLLYQFKWANGSSGTGSAGISAADSRGVVARNLGGLAS